MGELTAIEGVLFGVQAISGVLGISMRQREAASQQSAINLKEIQQKRQATQQKIHNIDQANSVFAAQQIAFEQRGLGPDSTSANAFRTKSYENMLDNNKIVSQNLSAEETQDEIQKDVASQQERAGIISGIGQLASSVFQGISDVKNI